MTSPADVTKDGSEQNIAKTTVASVKSLPGTGEAAAATVRARVPSAKHKRQRREVPPSAGTLCKSLVPSARGALRESAGSSQLTACSSEQVPSSPPAARDRTDSPLSRSTTPAHTVMACGKNDSIPFESARTPDNKHLTCVKNGSTPAEKDCSVKQDVTPVKTSIILKVMIPGKAEMTPAKKGTSPNEQGTISSCEALTPTTKELSPQNEICTPKKNKMTPAKESTPAKTTSKLQPEASLGSASSGSVKRCDSRNAQSAVSPLQKNTSARTSAALAAADGELGEVESGSAPAEAAAEACTVSDLGESSDNGEASRKRRGERKVPSILKRRKKSYAEALLELESAVLAESTPSDDASGTGVADSSRAVSASGASNLTVTRSSVESVLDAARDRPVLLRAEKSILESWQEMLLSMASPNESSAGGANTSSASRMGALVSESSPAAKKIRTLVVKVSPSAPVGSLKVSDVRSLAGTSAESLDSCRPTGVTGRGSVKVERPVNDQDDSNASESSVEVWETNLEAMKREAMVEPPGMVAFMCEDLLEAAAEDCAGSPTEDVHECVWCGVSFPSAAEAEQHSLKHAEPDDVAETEASGEVALQQGEDVPELQPRPAVRVKPLSKLLDLSRTSPAVAAAQLNVGVGKRGAEAGADDGLQPSHVFRPASLGPPCEVRPPPESPSPTPSLPARPALSVTTSTTGRVVTVGPPAAFSAGSAGTPFTPVTAVPGVASAALEDASPRKQPAVRVYSSPNASAALAASPIAADARSVTSTATPAAKSVQGVPKRVAQLRWKYTRTYEETPTRVAPLIPDMATRAASSAPRTVAPSATEEEDLYAFACSECAVFCRTRKLLALHRVTRHASETWHRCPVPRCTSTFHSLARQRLHVATAHDPMRFNCRYDCKTSLPSRMLMAAHLEWRHGKKRVRLVCPVCAAPEPDSSAALTAHLRARHPKVARLKCGVCGWATTDVLAAAFESDSIAAFVAHLRARHYTLTYLTCGVCGWTTNAPQATPFECDTSAGMTAHLQAQHPRTAPLTCGMCVWATNDVQRMLVHHERHVDELRALHCPYCAAWFPAKELLEAHVRAEHPDDCRYACAACDGNFETERQLLAHVEDEHERDPAAAFRCTCGARFESMDALVRHAEQTMHMAGGGSARKSFACSKCPAAVVTDPVEVQEHHDTVHLDLLPIDRVAQLMTLVRDARLLRSGKSVARP